MRFVHKVTEFLRIDEWMTSKVTMMLGILSTFLLQNGESVQEIYLNLGVYFCFLTAFLASSYVVNDISDIEVDKKAGKAKVVAQMPLWLAISIVVLLIVAGSFPIIFFSEHKIQLLILVVIIFLFGFAYSLPGIRFKERGIWGLIECAFAQRCLPLLIILYLVKLDVLQLLLLSGWFVISFCDGLRYILIHQIVDIKNDLNSGVKTFVSEGFKNYRNMSAGLFYAEAFLCAIVGIPILLKNLILYVVILICYVYLEFCIHKILNVYVKKDWFTTFDSVPLEAYLSLVMPMVIGLCMLSISLWLIPYCAVLLAICIKPMSVKIKIAKIYLENH